MRTALLLLALGMIAAWTVTILVGGGYHECSTIAGACR
jgi:hypothetical protein